MRSAYEQVGCHAMPFHTSPLLAGLHREQGELQAVDDLSHSLKTERDSMQKKLRTITETVHIEKVEFQKRAAGECAHHCTAFKRPDAGTVRVNTPAACCCTMAAMQSLATGGQAQAS